MIHRRAALVGGLVPFAARAQSEFPSRPIRLIVGVAPGASLDTLARGLARGMTSRFGTGIVVENQPGGGGLIATLQVARAVPDGHTLLMTADSLVLTEAMLPEAGYSVRRSFSPVTQAIRAAQVLATHPTSGLRTAQDYVAQARAQPGKLNLGLPGWGGIAHVISELLNRRLGLQVEQIPYRGGAPETLALLAREIDAMIITLPAIAEHIRSKRLVALAVSTGQRDPVFAEVPTLAETVAPGFDIDSWQGVVAPAGTPQAIVERLHDAIAFSLATPEIGGRLRDLGFDIVAAPPAEFARRLTHQADTLGQAVRDAGIRAERS